MQETELNTQAVTGSPSLPVSTADIVVGILVPAVILIVLIVLLPTVIANWFKRKVKDASWERESLETQTFEVRVPQTNEVEISAADQMFAGFGGIAGKLTWMRKNFQARNSIAFEIVAFPENIRFYITAPKSIAQLVEKQINAAYPDADIVPSKDYNIFPENSKVAFADLILKEDNFRPIKTYDELNIDSLSVITSAMSKLQKGESIVFQLLITPAGTEWRNGGKAFVKKVRDNNADPEKSKINVEEEVLSAIEKKTEKVGFLSDLRVVAVSHSTEEAKNNLDGVIGSLEQLKLEYSNSFKKKDSKKINANTFIRNFIYRIPQESFVLNTAELATLFHFPNQTVKVPHINWLLSKRAPAGPQISSVYTPGSVHLATSVYRETEKKIYQKINDRRRHTYMVGKTGAGKTNFMQRMVLQDIYNGHGLAFLDPHGDACEYILDRIPPERAEDIIYFNPADTERPIGLNFMEFTSENEKYRIVESFLGLLNKMFDPYNQGITGPRFQQAVRNAMLTAMAVPGSSLVEVVRIITDDKFVKKFLPYLKDDVVKRYWTEQMANTQEFHKSEILGHITSKFEKFVTNKLMRNIIAQSKSGFDMRSIMDNRKVLLINLSKGLLGEENSQFLGLLTVPRILSAAMSRADIPEAERKDFMLYVDEFQNFATDDFAQILSEARKYRLNLVVANQYIAQIDDKIRDAVFGNVGTIVSFKVGVNDAAYLQNEFNPVFNQNDLINLENYNIYTKMLVDGEYPAPFSAKVPYDPEKFPVNKEVADVVKELSRLRYGRDKGLIEKEIDRRSNSVEEAAATPDKKGAAGAAFQTPLKAASGEAQPVKAEEKTEEKPEEKKKVQQGGPSVDAGIGSTNATAGVG